MEINEIAAALPRKGQKQIAKRLGISHSLVSLVLSGKRQNDLVIDTALDLIEEIKAKQEARLKRLNNIISK
ncbi:hypothetical protein [Sphingobacterium spiritivorum]|uniref:hypothetical protein n=1 Tax=Sphingobacterium spiritivorum TaxID=258 RepID=UPI003DA43ED5